jgi:hypothetical protein
MAYIEPRAIMSLFFNVRAVATLRILSGSSEMSRRISISRKRKSSRRKGKPRVKRYSILTARERATYDRTTNLVTDLRRGEGSYTALLRKHHLGSRTARKYAGRNLLGGSRGRPVRASKADRRVRNLLFPMPSGDVPIRSRNSRDATKLSDYYNDREKLLRGKLGAANFEAKWRGVRIMGEEVFADAPTILKMADADVLRMENLYASVGSAE